ncbi:hypothetical protein VPH35_075141 [Triticum aestivum]
MDAKEQRRKGDREHYAQMTDEKRQEHNAQMTDEKKNRKNSKCAVKQIYANMQTAQKKARIENINELKRNTASKDSIAMENPAYIATEQEGSTSNFPVKHKKHVTPGERQALLHRRNEEFTRRRPKTASEDASMTETGDDDTEPLQQPEVMIYGNTLNFIQ